MSATYAYDPSKLAGRGKDLMRFELGDTMVEGGQDTCALCDEEYEALLTMYPDSWKKAKMHCIESIFRRFSYETDTLDGELSLKFGDRAKLWQEEYQKLKAEAEADDTDCHAIESMGCPVHREPYFRLGMMSRDGVGEVHER